MIEYAVDEWDECKTLPTFDVQKGKWVNKFGELKKGAAVEKL